MEEKDTFWELEVQHSLNQQINQVSLELTRMIPEANMFSSLTGVSPISEMPHAYSIYYFCYTKIPYPFPESKITV